MGTKLTSFAAVAICVHGIDAVCAQNAAMPPIQNWNYTTHASTATEGFLRGSAAAIQSAGQKNYLDSVALVNLQEAQRRAIENRKLYVQTYIQNRAAIREYRQKYAPVPPTAEEWAQVQEMSNPDRLTEKQLNRRTGAIVWPHVLRWDDYGPMRKRIETVLASRTSDNIGDGSPSQREVSTLIDGMKRILRSNVSSLDHGQFGAAHAFLKSLDFEMRFPLVDGADAPAMANIDID